jgi:hypothetical protein
MTIVLQIFGDFFVGKMTAKPGVPPEEEGHEHEQPARDEEEDAMTGGHTGALGGRLGHGFCGNHWVC